MNQFSWPDAAALIGLALAIGATLVLRGPVGRALAEWIRGWSDNDARWIAAKATKGGGDLAAPDALLAEVDELKRRLAEAEERLDFTERLLARERQAERLAPPR